MIPGNLYLLAGALMIIGGACCLALSRAGKLHDVPPKYREWLVFSLLLAGVRQVGWSTSLEWWAGLVWCSVGVSLCAIAWHKWQSRR